MPTIEPSDAPLAPPPDVPGAPRGMKTYVLGIFKRGPNYGSMTEAESEDLMQAHLAHIRKGIESGKQVFATPVFGDGEIAGLGYYRGASLREVHEWMAQDLGVQRGRFDIEVRAVWAPDLDPIQVRYDAEEAR